MYQLTNTEAKVTSEINTYNALTYPYANEI